MNDELDQESPKVTPISRKELNALILEGSVIVVDAQCPGWYQREHLPGAIKADLTNVEELVERLDDKATEIAVYCWSESCTGSVQVSKALAQSGFSNVRRYVEGKRDWLEAGLPVESDERDDDDA